MKTLIVIIIGHFIVGSIFSSLKIKYWKLLHSNGLISKYVKSKSIPTGTWIKIVLLWPLQALAWYESRTEVEIHSLAIPVLPIPLIIDTKERSRINSSIIHRSDLLNKNNFIKKQIFLGFMVGYGHVCANLLGYINWLIIFVVALAFRLYYGVFLKTVAALFPFLIQK